jgi:hypothetical protein
VNRALLPILLVLPIGCRGSFDLDKYISDADSGTMGADTSEAASSDASETRTDETDVTSDTQDATATSDTSDTNTDTDTTTDTETDTDVMCLPGTVDLGTACIGLRYTLLTSPSAPTDIVLGQFNGDNLLDLVVAGNPVTFFVGTDGATFGNDLPVIGASAPRLATVDWNSDGNEDLMTISDTEISILISNGNGQFALDITFFEGGYDGAFGDFDDDLDEDVILTGPTTRVLLRDGSDLSLLQEMNYSAQGLALADLDSDDDLDIALAMNATEEVGTVLTDGAWGFELPSRVSLPLAADVVVAHMDQDPNPEVIAVGGDPGQLFLGRVAPEGLVQLSSYMVGSLPRAVAVGDIDGDSANDVAVGNAASHDVSLLIGSRGGLTNEYRLPVDDPNDNPESIAVADLDNDGRAEIIVGMISSNRVLVYGHVQ